MSGFLGCYAVKKAYIQDFMFWIIFFGCMQKAFMESMRDCNCYL